MKTIKVVVSIGLAGCRRETTFQVDAGASEDEIDEQAREVMFGLITWDWREAK